MALSSFIGSVNRTSGWSGKVMRTVATFPFIHYVGLSHSEFWRLSRSIVRCVFTVGNDRAQIRRPRLVVDFHVCVGPSAMPRLATHLLFGSSQVDRMLPVR